MFEDEIFEDLMGVVVETGYAPLDKKLNSHICYKGGGGGGQTVTKSGIDEEFKPYLERALSDVTDRYEREVAQGPDAIVAALDPRQTQALGEQERLARDAISGTGIYDVKGETQRQLQNLAGQQMAANPTALGSARSMRAQQAALADKGYEFAKDRMKIAEGGVGALGEVGSAYQEYAQRRLDAPHTSAERYFGYLSGAPQTTTQTQSGGGGK